MQIKQELPIKQKISVFCFSSTKTKSRNFVIPFGVVDDKHKVLGTPFFENFRQNNNNQDFTMNFKQLLNDQPQLLFLPDFLFFSFLFIYLPNKFRKANIFQSHYCANITLSTDKYIRFNA